MAEPALGQHHPPPSAVQPESGVTVNEPAVTSIRREGSAERQPRRGCPVEWPIVQNCDRTGGRPAAATGGPRPGLVVPAPIPVPEGATITWRPHTPVFRRS